MRNKISFNKDWYFIKGIESLPHGIPSGAERVCLPHTWNGVDGQDGGNDYYRGRCAYLKKFTFQDIPRGDVKYIEIPAASSYAEVYLNGHLLCTHTGGYSAFRADVTDEIIDGENLFVITVDNSEMLHAYPSFADFTFYGGLYRGVNVISVPKSHFELDYHGGDGIAVDTTVRDGCAEVRVRAYVRDAKTEHKLRYSILDGAGRVVMTRSVAAESCEQRFDISSPHLWHGVKDPYLYTAEVVLLDGDGLLDVVRRRFGIRSFYVDPERGFFLNGEHYPLHGVSRHQDRPGIGNALLPEHHREDVALIRELGANTVRLAHYQHDSYFYDLCDEVGLVVWAEIPYISKHKKEGRENTVSQLTELIVQNYNHPSICFWGLSNEITMSGAEDADLIENHRILNELAHTLDPSRLTVVAAVSMCDTNADYLKIPDLVAYNHYFGWYGGDVSMNGPWFDKFHTDHPLIPIGVSEYGCEGLDYHSSAPTQGDYTEEYQAYYHESVAPELFKRNYIWGTYVWNMFDFGADARSEGGAPGKNHKGLVTFDRRYKKDAFYLYRAYLSDEPFVHICSKRYERRADEYTEIKVYSNQPSVELFVDGASVACLLSDDRIFRFSVKNTGTQHIVARSGKLSDEFYLTKVEEFDQTYRLCDTGTVLNWFEIDMPDGYLSINDKIDVIMRTDDGRKIVTEMLSSMKNIAKGDTDVGVSIDSNLFSMLGGFTLIRLMGMAGMMGVEPRREDLLSLNRALNRIKKPE